MLNFDEFDKISYKHWQNQVAIDLANDSSKQSSEKSLTFETQEEIRLKPLYYHEDKKFITLSNGNEFYTRGLNSHKKDLFFSPIVRFHNLGNFIEQTQACKLAGASAMVIDLGNTNSEIDEEFFKKMPYTELSLEFILARDFQAGFFKILNNLPKDCKTVVISYDPISEALKGTNLLFSLEHSMNFLEKLVLKNIEQQENVRILNIDSSFILESGGDHVTEVSYLLSSLNFYLQSFSKYKIPAEQLLSQIQLTLGVDQNIFISIAKNRAARFLISKMLEHYQIFPILHDEFFNCKITRQYWSTIEPEHNLVRMTHSMLAAFSCNPGKINCPSYDFTESPQSINTTVKLAQMISQESHFSNYNDPAGGSYFLEELTEQIAQNAWYKFQEVLEIGLIKSLEQGYWVSRVQESRNSLESDYLHLKRKLIGVNLYANATALSVNFSQLNNESGGDIKKQVHQLTNSELIKEIRSFIASEENSLISTLKAASLNLSFSDLKRAFESHSQNYQVESLPQYRFAEAWEKIRSLGENIDHNTVQIRFAGKADNNLDLFSLNLLRKIQDHLSILGITPQIVDVESEEERVGGSPLVVFLIVNKNEKHLSLQQKKCAQAYFYILGTSPDDLMGDEISKRMEFLNLDHINFTFYEKLIDRLHPDSSNKSSRDS